MSTEPALAAKATVVLSPEIAEAVEQTRERVAELTGSRPSVAMVLQGALRRAMQRGLLGELPDRADRAA